MLNAARRRITGVDGSSIGDCSASASRQTGCRHWQARRVSYAIPRCWTSFRAVWAYDLTFRAGCSAVRSSWRWKKSIGVCRQNMSTVLNRQFLINYLRCTRVFAFRPPPRRMSMAGSGEKGRFRASATLARRVRGPIKLIIARAGAEPSVCRRALGYAIWEPARNQAAQAPVPLPPDRPR